MGQPEQNSFHRKNGEASLSEPPPPDGADVKKNKAKDNLLATLARAESALGGDVVFYSGPVNEDGYGQFVQATKNISPDKTLVLGIATYGGSADSAYRIARYAQNYFRDFVAFVPSECKSAGTLLVLGASKIFMSPFGELGPLDIQVLKANEIFERRSGLHSKSAVISLTEEAFRTFEHVLLSIKMRSGGAIGFKASSQVAAQLASALIAPIVGQLDPLSIGEDFQNLHIARDYGDRLIEKYGVINSEAISALVENYPSHAFVIDLFEAQNLLGNVEIASEELIQLHACMPQVLHHPSATHVSVQRLRDVFPETTAGDSDDHVNEEAETPHSGGAERDRTEGQDQKTKRRDRRRNPQEGNGTDDHGDPSEG